jgi:hypothetical protein
MSENEPKRVEEQPDEQGGQGRCSGKAENIHRWVRWVRNVVIIVRR